MSLLEAVDIGDLEGVHAALQQGEPPDTADDSGVTALHLAADRGFAEVASMLIDAGAGVNLKDPTAGETPLHVAVRQNQEDVVALLLASGAEVNSADFTGITPLHLAAWVGSRAIAEQLIGAGADVHVVDSEEGRTPLHLAAMAGHVELVDLLVSHGAAADAADFFGRTPLWRAACNGHGEVVDALLTLGADLNARDQNGETPLLAALVAERADVARALLAMGADPTAQETQNGSTALHLAAAAGDQETVRLLLASGADPSAVDHNGATPFDAARAAGHADLIELLQSEAGPTAGAAVQPPIEQFGTDSAAAEEEEDLLPVYREGAPPPPPPPRTAMRHAEPAAAAALRTGVRHAEPAAETFAGSAPAQDESAHGPPAADYDTTAAEEHPPVEERAPETAPPPRPARPSIDARAYVRAALRAGRLLMIAAIGFAAVGVLALAWIRLDLLGKIRNLVQREFDVVPSQVTPAKPAPVAIDVPPRAGPINDFAQVLDALTVQRVAELAAEIKAKGHADVSVVVVSSTKPATPEDYARAVVRQWKLGDSAVLLVVGVEEKEAFVHVGAALAGVLTEERVYDVVAEQIFPLLGKEDFSGGVRTGLEALARTLGHTSPPPRAEKTTSLRAVAVTVDSSPPGATVFIDHGLFTCVTPCILSVPPGTHFIEVRKRGFVAASENIKVPAAPTRFAYSLNPRLD